MRLVPLTLAGTRLPVFVSFGSKASRAFHEQKCLVFSVGSLRRSIRAVGKISRLRTGLAQVCIVVAMATVAAPALAQNNTLGEEGSVPIPGVGQENIYGLSETVSPSNGTVNLKINLPTPKSRGTTLPYAITYNSGSVHRFSSGQEGCGSLNTDGGSGGCPVGPLSLDRRQVGWSDTLPYTSVSAWVSISASPAEGPGNTAACFIVSSYNLYDMFGGAHPLGLASISQPYSYTQSGPYVCQQIPAGDGYFYAGSSSGGDDEVVAQAQGTCLGLANTSTCPGTPFTAKDLAGNTYQFPSSYGEGTNDFTLYGAIPPITQIVVPSTIEDRNGNITTFGNKGGTPGGLPIVDSAGRTIISASNANGPITSYPVHGNAAPGTSWQPTTYTIGDLNYVETYTGGDYEGYTSQSHFISAFSGGNECDGIFTVASGRSASQVASITAPNGTSYQFTYDSVYNLVQKVTYPGGGWVAYTYKLSDDMNELAEFSGSWVQNNGLTAQLVPGGECYFRYQTPVVATRTIGYGKNSPAALTQSFTYNTDWGSDPESIDWKNKTTTVTTTDLVTLRKSQKVYTYSPIARTPQVNEGGQTPAELPVETMVVTTDLGTIAAPSSHVLETVTKTWADQFEMTSQQTSEGLLGGGMPSKWTAYCYSNANDLLEEKDEYAYGAGGPALRQAPPNSFWQMTYATCGPQTGAARRTVYWYAASSGSPCKTIEYDSNNQILSETDEYLDGGSAPCTDTVAQSPTLVGKLIAGTHDHNYEPGAGIARGNVTSVVRWVNNGSPIITNASYDDTGQMLTSTDACGNSACSDMTAGGHTTQYVYTDNYSDATPAGATNTYLTSVISPAPDGHSALEKSYQYRYSDGQITSATDVANNLTTTYTYADPLNRLKDVKGPPDPNNGNGQADTSYTYNDTLCASTPCTSPSVTTEEVLNASETKTTVTIHDGMGHSVETQLQSDLLGTDFVDTVFDGSGNVVSVTNPYRGQSADGTTFSYDALGRKVLQVDADTSTAQWCYNGIATAGQTNCMPNQSRITSAGTWVDVSDEAGSHTQSVTDSMGRLGAVMEPDPNTGLPATETDYTYDALNNLTQIVQNGQSGETARVRQFAYDSLSRLLWSSNPETGVTCYGQGDGTIGGCQPGGYDANGNLIFKTTGNAFGSIYDYDVLNRLTFKGSQGISELYTYDEANVSNYAIGRMTTAKNSGYIGTPSQYDLATTFQYDVAGRVVGTNEAFPDGSAAGMGVSYDLAGDVTLLTYPDSKTVSQVWDAAGRLACVNDSSGNPYLGGPSPGSPCSSTGGVQYWPWGAENSYALGNGVTQLNGYNERMQIETAMTSAPSPLGTGLTPVINRNYVYAQPLGGQPGRNCPQSTGNNGNIWAINDYASGQVQNFCYDTLNRLTESWSQSLPNAIPYDLSYTYDSFGNMIPNDNMIASNPIYTIDPATNRMGLLQNNLNVFQYDGAGNLTSSLPYGHSFDYNGLSQIMDVDGGKTASYIYDGLDERVFKTQPNASDPSGATTAYIYLGGQVMATQDGNGAWTDYVYANGKKIARMGLAVSAVIMTGTRDQTTTACGVEGELTSAANVKGLRIAAGDALVMDTKQAVATYGGVALMFDDGTGTGEATDNLTQQPLFFNGQSDGQWHHMTADLSQYAGKTVTLAKAGIHNQAPAGNFELDIANVKVVHADATVTPVVTEAGSGVASFSGDQCGGKQLNAATGPVQVGPPTTGTTSHASPGVYYYADDALGTLQMEFDATGNVAWQGGFAPFGQEAVPTGRQNVNGAMYTLSPTALGGTVDDGTTMPFKFTGKERDDESGGLDDFGARYYASYMGRWMSPDWSAAPTGIPYAQMGNPQSFNLYAYVGNNPTRQADADGHCSPGANGGVGPCDSYTDTINDNNNQDYLEQMRNQDKEEDYERVMGFNTQAQQQNNVSATGQAPTPGHPIDKDAITNYADQHAEAHSQGKCAAYCRRAFEAGGVDTNGHPVDAKDWGPTLLKNGATVISPDGYKPQKADVAVFAGSDAHPHGHITIYDGKQWVSDFKQNNMSPYGSGATPSTIYRFPDN